MKLTNVFVLVSLFFFLIGCDNNVKKITPAEEAGDDSETIDDSETPDTETPDTETPDTELPDTETPDTETPDSETPDSETPDEPAVEDTCYAAEFNGTDSKIEVPANEALNLAYETWTIEAWIKQAEDEIPTYAIYPVLRKGTGDDYDYLLSGYYKQQTGGAYGLSAHVHYSIEWNGNTYPTDNKVDTTFNEFSSDWTHVAMVQTKEEGGNYGMQQETYKLSVFLNGHKVGSGNYNGTPVASVSEEPVIIGANLSKERFFKGLIDSIKISNTAKYSEEFTPSVLSADENTVAFWDFTNNADDASENGLNGTETNLNYVNDCKK